MCSVIHKKERAHMMSIHKYFELLGKISKEATEFVQQASDPCKKPAQRVAQMLQRKKLEVESYLAVYGITDYSSTLL